MENKIQSDMKYLILQNKLCLCLLKKKGAINTEKKNIINTLDKFE